VLSMVVDRRRVDLATTTTDDVGHFRFTGIPSGEYWMRGVNYFCVSCCLSSGSYPTCLNGVLPQRQLGPAPRARQTPGVGQPACATP
jgi:hypothetical protein